MNRKDFLIKCSAYCAGSAGLTAMLAGCSSYHYAQYTLENTRLVVRRTEFIEKKGEVEVPRAFVLVKPEHLEFPVCVYRFGPEEFIAIYTRCTHQGCEVQPHNEYLVCPCHGSEFSNRGQVINPPADQDLQQFKVSLTADNILIHLPS